MKKLKIELTKKFVSFVLPDIRNIIPDGTSLVIPSQKSPKGVRVPEVIAISGNVGLNILKILIALPYLLKTIHYAKKSSRTIKKLPQNAKKKANEKFFKELEVYSKNLGCSDIGYTEVPIEYVFRNRALLFKNAIILIMDMNKEKIKQAPSVVADKEVWRTYAELSKAVYKLSEFMKKKDTMHNPILLLGAARILFFLLKKRGLDISESMVF